MYEKVDETILSNNFWKYLRFRKITVVKLLRGVYKQTIFEVLRQNHGIEEYYSIFWQEVFGCIVKNFCFEYYDFADTIVFLGYLKFTFYLWLALHMYTKYHGLRYFVSS